MTLRMLTYFPIVYPDELLYSVVARWLRDHGDAGRTFTLSILFGRRFASAAIDIPGWIDHLAEQIPPARQLTADVIIDAMTLFPYYTAYTDAPIRARARVAMKSGSIAGFHTRLGIAAFRVPNIRALKFCASCNASMLKDQGELYWRRDLQLPSVLVCPIHGSPLQVSRVHLQVCGRYEYVAAQPSVCPSDAPILEVPRDSRSLRLLGSLATASADLLHTPGTARTPLEWTAYYRERLASVGLAWSPKRMRQGEFETAFGDHFGRVLDAFSGLFDGEAYRGDWLASMVRARQKASHPLQHLLLESFLDSRSVAEPVFGRGPWPCLNPISDHRNELTIAAVTHRRNHGHPIGVFACECGYVYTRRLNSSTGVLEAGRVRRFGALFETELRRLVAEGLSQRAIAKRLEVDPTTVSRWAHTLGLSVSWTIPHVPHRRMRSKAERKPLLTPKVPGRGKRKETARRRDWEALDSICVEGILKVADRILELSPPTRVSTAEIERRLGRRGWISLRRSKLPQSNALLAKLIETKSAFETRRILWAFNRLSDGDEPIRAWKVMRLAGLHSDALPRIRRILANHEDR